MATYHSRPPLAIMKWCFTTTDIIGGEASQTKSIHLRKWGRDVLVRGFERDNWNLKKKLKRLEDSYCAKGLGMLEIKVNLVSLDKKNRCIRMCVYQPLLCGEK